MVLTCEVCDFDARCLENLCVRVTSDCVVTLHLLPWFPALSIAFLVEGHWVSVCGGRFDFCLDYDWFLWLAFESGLME